MLQTTRILAFGRTAEVMEYDDKHVLKLFKKGLPDQLVNEEYEISLRVHQSGMTVPEPIKKTEMDDRPGIVYERAYGDTMLSRLSKKPWLVWKEAARLAQTHLDMHTRKVSGLPKQKELLHYKINEAPVLTPEEKSEIIERLRQLPAGQKLCHGDFHPDNVIVGERVWVIDWMTGMIGNPAGDAARTILLLRMGTLPDGTPALLAAFKKEYEGQGIGRSLVGFAEEWALGRGSNVLYLTSGIRPERIRAHEFYKSIGFDTTGYRFVKKLER